MPDTASRLTKWLVTQSRYQNWYAVKWGQLPPAHRPVVSGGGVR